MHAVPVGAEHLLLHEGLPQAHVDAPLDLADDQDGVDALSDVVRQVDPLDAHPPRLRIDVQLDDRGAEGVGRRRADARSLVLSGRRRRRVGADRADRAEPRLGQDDRLGERHAAVRILDVEDPSFAEAESLHGHAELFGRHLRQKLARALRRLDRRVAHHQGDAAAVRAEIDRRQVGVAEHDPDIVGIDPEHLRDHLGENGVGALTDVDFAAEDRDTAAPVQPDLHPGMRHVVPVDRQAGAAEIGRARQADPLAARQAAELLLPLRSLDHRPDALSEAHRSDAQVVGGQRAGSDEVPEAQLGRIHPQRRGDLVEMDFERESGLRRAVPALRAARRLVREHPRTLKPVSLDVVGDRLQGARVVGAGDTVRSVPPAVEIALEVHRLDRPVFRHAGPDLHEDRVAAAVAVEDLLARQRDLHGPAGQKRQLRDDDLVVERVALAAEPSPVRAGDHADVRRRHLKDLRQGPVHIVRRLRARPDRDLAVGIDHADGGVLLHREVRAAFVIEGVLEDPVRLAESTLDVAELERDFLVDVPLVAVVVDAGRRLPNRLLDRQDRVERLVLDLDGVHGVERRVLVDRRDGGDRIADQADLVQAQRVLVLADRQDPEGDRQVLPGEDRENPRHLRGLRGVDADDARVRDRRSVQLAKQHPGQDDVVGELRHPGALGEAVHLSDGGADHAQGAAVAAPAAGPAHARPAGHGAPPPPASHPGLASAGRPARPPRRS